MAHQRNERGKKTLSVAAAVTGAAIGGAPGALAGKAIDIVGGEVLDRALAREERRRTEGLFKAAKARLEERLARGERLRDDDFFTTPPSLARRMSSPWGAPRPPAHEIFEAVLLCAGRTYEESKLPHLAELPIALAFDPEVSPSYAHYLVRIADRLSYRQLLLLQIFNGDSLEPGLTDGDVRPDSRTGVGMEMEELARAGLLPIRAKRAGRRCVSDGFDSRGRPELHQNDP
jgi:hypothetical protein